MDFSLEIGKLVIVRLAGSEVRFVGEVIGSGVNFSIKVTEGGPMSNIKYRHFKVLQDETSLVQQGEESLKKIIIDAAAANDHLYSGLKTFNITTLEDIYELSPIEEGKEQELN